MNEAYKVLGTITVSNGAVVDLAPAFATLLDESLSSPLCNSLLFQAHEGNAGRIYIGDQASLAADLDTWGFYLVAGDRIVYAGGAESNGVNPRSFRVTASAASQKVRVSIMKR